jgi:hypothetical protein
MLLIVTSNTGKIDDDGEHLYRTQIEHPGPCRQLWLELTGFVFLTLAGIGAVALAREYTLYHARQATPGRVLVAIFFTGMFAWFGLSSFWRVSKKR